MALAFLFNLNFKKSGNCVLPCCVGLVRDIWNLEIIWVKVEESL